MSGNDLPPQHCNGCPRYSWYGFEEAKKYMKCGKTLIYEYIARGLKRYQTDEKGTSRFLQSDMDEFLISNNINGQDGEEDDGTEQM